MKVVIYSRVSSESERQDTSRQTQELKEYSKRMGYELVGVFEEKVSGFKKNEQRPIFSEMLEKIKEGSIDKILVWELSRIGRSVLQSLQNIQLLTDLKVGIYIKNFNLETLNEDKSPNQLAMFMVQILFSVANMESQLTLSRLQSGYKNHVRLKGSKSVGRKLNSVQTEQHHPPLKKTSIVSRRGSQKMHLTYKDFSPVKYKLVIKENKSERSEAL